MKHMKSLITAGAVTALLLGGLGAAQIPATKNVQWVLAPGSTTSSPFAGGPQHLYTGQCGTGIIQNDTYRYDTEQQKQLVDSLVASGVLDHYADSPVFISVTWSKQTPCSTPTPTPVPTPVPTTPPAPPVVVTPPVQLPPVKTSVPAAPPAAPAAPVTTTAHFTG